MAPDRGADHLVPPSRNSARFPASPHLDGSEHALTLMSGAVVGVRACGCEGELDAVAARRVLDRIVWTSAVTTAGLARRQTWTKGMSAEAAGPAHLLPGSNCQALLIVNVAEASTEVDGPRRARGGCVGEAGAAVDSRLKADAPAASA